MTILVGYIDEKLDKDVQMKKARKIWYRIKGEHDNAYGIPGSVREVSKKNTDMKWKGVMDSLDETELHYMEEIKVSNSVITSVSQC